MGRKSRHTMTMNRKSAKERERKQRKKLLTRCRVIEKICVWKRQLKREREREREREIEPFPNPKYCCASSTKPIKCLPLSLSSLFQSKLLLLV